MKTYYFLWFILLSAWSNQAPFSTGFYYGSQVRFGLGVEFFASVENDVVEIHCYERVKKEHFFKNKDVLRRTAPNQYIGKRYELIVTTDVVTLHLLETDEPLPFKKIRLERDESKKALFNILKQKGK